MSTASRIKIKVKDNLMYRITFAVALCWGRIYISIMHIPNPAKGHRSLFVALAKDVWSNVT